MIGRPLSVVVLALMLLTVRLPVPDTHTDTGASEIGEVNDWMSVGQSFRPIRDGLTRIDVAMSTLKGTDQSDIQFYVREEPRGANLRALRLVLDEIPEGEVRRLSSIPFQDPPWVSFKFDPLWGHNGKQLYFNIEGKDVGKDNTIQALLAYPNNYKRGEGYKSENAVGGSMVFRAYTNGSVLDLVDATIPLLSKGRPGLLGSDITYWALLSFGAILVMILLASVPKPQR